MKATNKVSALSLVVEQLTTEKPFDSISVVQCLAREIVGYNRSSDKLVELQKQIDDTKNEKGARKKGKGGERGGKGGGAMRAYQMVLARLHIFS